PFHDTSAPPGPSAMPQFKNPQLEESKRLNTEAAAKLAEGTVARETADHYVRDTVLFATVLFVIAIAQRFKIRTVRLGANALALVLLVYALYGMSGRPRL